MPPADAELKLVLGSAGASPSQKLAFSNTLLSIAVEKLMGNFCFRIIAPLQLSPRPSSEHVCLLSGLEKTTVLVHAMYVQAGDSMKRTTRVG